MINVFTMFSGGLAAPEFALKYENIPHQIIGAAEFDKYARKQYLQFHGEPKEFYNDVRDIDGTKYKDQIDLLIYGSPCQDLSLAGKRKGFDGAKSSLFREGARVMSEMMPKTFIFENVKGLLSSNNGNDYKEVLNTFIEMGYHITTQVLNTKDYGIPQNRERVFIVGFLDHYKHLGFEFEKTTPLKLKLMDMLEDDVDEKYFLSNSSINRIKKSNRSISNGDTNTKVAPCIIAQYSKIPTDGFYIKSATKSGYETATQNDSINFTHPNSKTRRGRVGKGVAQTLDCACNQGVIINPLKGKTNFGWHFEQKVYSKDSCTRALTASEGSGSREKVMLNNYKIRKLTPKECFKLQGVKDKDINLVVSDTQAYKISGNAISVNVMQSILRSLYKNKTQNLFSWVA